MSLGTFPLECSKPCKSMVLLNWPVFVVNGMDSHVSSISEMSIWNDPCILFNLPISPYDSKGDGLLVALKSASLSIFS